MAEPRDDLRPILSVSLGYKTDSLLVNLQLALSNLAKQDPMLKPQLGSADGQITLLGMSEAELESLCERISNDYKVEIEAGTPQVLYLETIRKEAEAEGKYIRQTGGCANYAHCKIRLSPNDSSIGYEFVNNIQNGVIPSQFIASIDEGIREAMDGGVLAGCAMVNVTATLYDGSYHQTESNEMAYKIAASIAFKEAARKAHPILLEPIMSAEIFAPEEFMGIVIADVNNRRGRIKSIESRDGSQVIHAIVPLSETLSSSLYGQVHYPTRFSHYEPAFRGGDAGENEAGVTANRPRTPTSGSRHAAVRPEEQFESSDAIGRRRDGHGSEPFGNLAEG